MSMKRRRGLHAGRPPAGFNGALSSKYPQLAVRVPPATLDRLRALAAQEGRPMWRILADAIETYDGLDDEAAARFLPTPQSPRV